MKSYSTDLCCRVMQATASSLVSDSLQPVCQILLYDLHNKTNKQIARAIVSSLFLGCVKPKKPRPADQVKNTFFVFAPIRQGTNRDIPVEIYQTNDIEHLKSSGFSKAFGWVYKLWWHYICYACPIGTHVKPGGKECIDCSAGQLHWVIISSCLDQYVDVVCVHMANGCE